jgi:hypothetical protein
MRRAAMAAAMAAAILFVATASAAETPAAAGGVSTEAKPDAGCACADQAAAKKDYVFLTGLDYSYWAADAGPNLGGPGVSIGFVLVPRHLEVDLALGAMVGGHQYTLPVELGFTVPFYVTPWFAPYLKFGPTVFTDKVQSETTYDFGVSAHLGIELVPRGFDWGIYASGDYTARTSQEIRHQGGFTVGFHYRI